MLRFLPTAPCRHHVFCKYPVRQSADMRHRQEFSFPEYIFEQHAFIFPVQRRTRGNNHIVDQLLLAIKPQSLAKHYLDNTAHTTARHTQPGCFCQTAAGQPAWQTHRLFHRQRRVLISLNTHGAQRRAIQLRFREEHCHTRVPIAFLNAQFLCKSRQMPAVSHASDLDDFFKVGVFANNTDSERHGFALFLGLYNCPFKPLCMFTVFNMSVAKDTALTCFIKLFHLCYPIFGEKEDAVARLTSRKRITRRI